MNKIYFNPLFPKDLVGKKARSWAASSNFRKYNPPTFGFILLLFSMLLSTGFGFAQSIANYSFGSGNDGSLQDISAGNTNYLTGINDDVAGTVQALGFDFYFMGQRYSHFSANSNGQMRLHGSSTEAPIGSNVSTAANAAILAPFTGDNEVNNGMRYKVIGTAPNRTFVLEWNQFYINFVNLTNAGDMQVWLDESTGKITYIYGQIYNSSTASQTRSISLASSNTATTVGSVTIGSPSTFTVGATPVANTIAAGANPVGLSLVSNIGSASDGNRFYFTFTPPSTVVGGPSAFTITNVTGTGNTLNWIDDSTNELFFIITRATDAAFTQNLTAFSVPSTSSASVGTPYTLVQTGLAGGTTYYYRIVATVEGGASAALSNSSATLDGATYYWTGATGGNWNTFSNWNTAADGSGTAPAVWDNSDILVIDGTGTTPGGTLSILVDRPSFTLGQLKITNNTDLSLASNNTTTRVITVSGGPGTDLVLELGSTLNLVNAANAVTLNFTTGGQTGQLAGTYIAGGSTSNLINVTNSVNTTVSGAVTNNILGVTGCLTGSVASLSFAANSNYTHTGNTTGQGYIPIATWDITSTATITGGTTTTGLTSGSPSLGNLIVNTTALTTTLNAFAGNTRIIQGNLTINNTGTGRFRAVSTGLLTVNGNIIVNGGIFDISGSSTGRVVAKGDVIVNTGGTLDINQGLLQAESNIVNNGAILSSETTTTNSRINFAGTAGSQAFSGTGSFSGRVSSIGLANAQGLVISTPVLTQRVNLFTGTITGSTNITIGTGAALGAAVQIGFDANTAAGGNFDATPTFNLGTGTYSLLYLGESMARTTGFEVPSSRIVSSIVVNNSNGLNIAGGDLTAVSALTLTSGIVSTGANTLILGDANAAGTLTGGSETAYVNGTLTRFIANGNTNTTYSSFPIGKAGVYTPIAVAPATTSVASFKAESFGSNSGTATAAIINLSAARRFEVLPLSGTFDNINVRLSDPGMVATNIPVQAPSAAGAYTSAFGSTSTYAAGPPVTITSNTPVASANYTGYLSFADSNACNGIPNPGNTVATNASICFGASVTLSLQNTTPGAGVTYQWQSSADGVAFADIVDAIGSTYTVTITSPTFFRCVVSCSGEPVTGISTPIQVSFANTVVSTTPATRCGAGVVTLQATPSAGATINWYANASGGAPLATGTSFQTPSLSATTTYFASASTPSNGSATLGLGAVTSTSTGATFFPGSWGGAKTQYIIRASELAAAGFGAGPIASIGFEPTTSGQTYQGFVVQMGHTSQTTATTTFISNLTQVFRGTLADDGYTPTPNVVNTLAFGTGVGSDSAFNWDGISNIVVSISWSRVPAAATATSSGMKLDDVGFVATAWRQRDNLTPAAMLAETSASSTGSNRPRFTINGVLLCNSPRVAVEATVTTPPAFALSATTTTICAGNNSEVITIATGANDYDTFVWSPAIGVSGSGTQGWTFNTTATTTYTLTASQSSGSLCVITATVVVQVNQLPAPLTFTSTVDEACLDTALPLSVSGGILNNVPILTENFNAATNAFTTINNTTGGTNIATSAWTLRPSGFVQGATFITSDASQFYLSNSDAGGSGTNTDASLISPSFSTVNFTSANLTFKHYYNHWASGNGIASVAYSIDNGGTWTNIQTYTATVGAANNFASVNLTLPPAALNQANVQIRFRHLVVYGFYWAIDDLAITGNQQTQITWSPITNLFSDAAATVPYVAGTSASTVYFKSNTAATTAYTATATSAALCTTSATVDITAIDCAIPYANLQFPGTATITTCGTQIFYARVYKAGVTEAPGQGAGITAWIGRNTTNTDPATWPESSWQLATFNVQTGNDDEYQATFGPLASGTYYVASRFVYAPGTFVYGGYTPSGGGIWNGTSIVSAVLTVETPAPTASAQTFCNAATVADLVATGTGLQWYADATGGTALAATTALASGNYYVSQTIDGCESPRTMVAVTVNVTAAPTAAAQTFCNAATVANLVATGTGLQWYAAATGGSPLAATTALASGNYYVSQTLNACESPRTMVAVTVNVTAAPTASAQTFCNAATVANLVATGTGLQWYAAATGGSPLAGTTALASGNYYVSQTLNACESPRTMVAVTINVTAAPTGLAVQNFTTGQTLANFTVVGQNIIWYSSATGTTVLPASTLLVSGVTYYASQTVNGCESTSRLAVTAGVNLSTPEFDIRNLRYYPNPVVSLLNVEFSDTIQGVQLYNMLGQMVYSKVTDDAKVSIDMSGMPAGNYILQVTANGITKNVKVIKK